MQFVPTLPAEEVARANFYALLARLFYAPPDEAVLEALAGSEDLNADAGNIADAWRALSEAAGEADAQALREAYDSTFVGTGKAPITLYSCAYSIRYASEVPLVALKADLAALGLARNSEVSEPEDHIAALCEVMRHLISDKRELEEQKHFFERWIWPITEPLCAAIEKSEVRRFYRAVARFAKVFFALEHEAFEML
jgi:TorA maturation chaperone TorD